MDRRWKRNSVSLVSSVTTVMRRPISCVTSMAVSCHAPTVSMANGQKCGCWPNWRICPSCSVSCCTCFDHCAADILLLFCQASTQTLGRRENNGLQWTSWQRRYFEKKPRFPFEVPRTAAETDTLSLSECQ